jgi:hypothetical protein
MTSSTTLAPGNYTLFVKADGYSSGAVAETNESNNTASVALTVPGRPDLTVTALSTGTITRNGNGSYNIPLTFTVKNVGETTAKASWTDSCYLSTDATLDTSDNYMAYEYRSTDLAPNAEYTVSKTCVTPTTTTPGNYYLIVKADVYGSGTHYSALVEASETNNAMSLAIVLLP